MGLVKGVLVVCVFSKQHREGAAPRGRVRQGLDDGGCICLYSPTSVIETRPGIPHDTTAAYVVTRWSVNAVAPKGGWPHPSTVRAPCTWQTRRRNKRPDRDRRSDSSLLVGRAPWHQPDALRQLDHGIPKILLCAMQ
jgi:hypothetical protein